MRSCRSWILTFDFVVGWHGSLILVFWLRHMSVNKSIQILRFETGTIHQLVREKAIAKKLLVTETCHWKALLKNV